MIDTCTVVQALNILLGSFNDKEVSSQ